MFLAVTGQKSSVDIIRAKDDKNHDYTRCFPAKIRDHTFSFNITHEKANSCFLFMVRKYFAATK